ncbi:spermatogenesis-associated protein 24 isoform X1 [Ictidomys tridecemlineatus]|uniref:spermatogenesis-associated protein 24 isoform X1 n=1 Tax=Ictidomys tridecemlineatus TaxID=43179 RepID=UPI00038C076A|nr:spermatogenesis-associated protein 24 isoform X1 [Ictidomys tridecemlineatus]XP_015340258.1 spermatogenesis-associated protein 24 isoform X1 [Marmota marmota marmota]XP_026257068.1 spermatogenesis-associated protein 24 isoform X1 [Urocitellus parryii]KAG3266191.1 spermatogenesis associated 24, transcript variant X1 [Ictidomys tridecemlineatus]
MATPLGWSQGGSGSVCLAFDQLRDVIESQEELIHQLRNVMILQDENFVSKEEFQAVEKKLVEEKAAHAKTKVLLAKEEEKLQFALGEVEVLSKQLEKEKLAFEKALSNVKSRVLQESSKKDQLITKCNEIESHIIKQEDILNGKENEIKELQQVICQQKQIFSPRPASWLRCRNHMSDFRIQKQQENYMAQVLDQKHKKTSGMRQARRHQRLREK